MVVQQRRRSRLRILVSLGLVVMPIFGFALPGLIEAGYAAGTPTFDGSAEAFGVHVTLDNESIPLGLTAEASIPYARARLSSVGDSDATASAAYPGDSVAGVPGIAGALFGNLPTPAYPVYATTGSGEAPKDVDAPGVSMHAESGRSAAVAKGSIGGGGAGLISDARVDLLSDDSVRATASTNTGVSLLNLINVSGVQSTATVTADPFTGALTRQAHLSIAKINIPGLSATYPSNTPGSIPLPIPLPGVPQLPPLQLPSLPIPLIGGTTLPIPELGFKDGSFSVTLPLLGKTQEYAIPAQMVLDAMKALGIDLTYQAAKNTKTGIIAPVLTFHTTLPAPPSNQYLHGATPVTMELGKTMASLFLQPAPVDNGGFSFPPSGSSLPPVTTTGNPSTGGVSTGGSGSPSAGGLIGAGSSGAPGGDIPAGGLIPGTGDDVAPPATDASVPVGTSDVGSVPQASGGQVPATGSGVPVASISDINRADLSGLYLVGVLIGAAALCGGVVLRMLGVRLLWGS